MRIKERGSNDPKILICDDFSGINNVFGSVFPTTLVQKCNFHKIQNALNEVPRKERKIIAPKIKMIYEAKDINEAYRNFVLFQNEYAKKYKRVIKAIENSLDEMLTFFDLPKGLRKHIYTNNICENFNSALRKYVKEKSSHYDAKSLKMLAILASFLITRTWENRRIIF
ncbi:Transposase, Mutator family [Mycoplasmopsis verecunda]|uniref:Mutator family transposase n=1 Tax=Mycoplasmopsis verecunda TaxID=171291 RepID=A0A1T4M7S8_9BACT|nr:Transposase, Mutator family [Mycoplasmopsis verecunda]